MPFDVLERIVLKEVFIDSKNALQNNRKFVHIIVSCFKELP